MNVLSLFDGMSCGQIALQRANIDYCNYFASEINKQSVPIDYTAGISDSARRTMLGEGWTVDIIAHIFRYIKNTPGNP